VDLLIEVLDRDHDGEIQLEELQAGLQKTRRALMGLAEHEDLPEAKPLPPRPPPPPDAAAGGASSSSSSSGSGSIGMEQRAADAAAAAAAASAVTQLGGGSPSSRASIGWNAQVPLALGKFKRRMSQARTEREKILVVLEALERYVTVNRDKMAAKFAELDTDGSGALSPQEFRGVLDMLRLPLEKHETELLIEVLDRDHDGQIELEELESGLQKTRRALMGLAEHEDLPEAKPLPPRPPPPEDPNDE
jgi:Ca2+-binding EF-hand superfamily protein